MNRTRRGVDLVADLRAAADLLAEAADYIDNTIWGGMPPSTISPGRGSPIPAPVKSAPARNVPCAALTVPQSVAASADSAGAGEVRLVETTAMPLTGPEFVEPDQADPHGIVRSSGLWLVRL